MRISDADRDRAASILSHALAQGRLTPQEHSERLDTIFAAKTQADIVPVVSDLPGATEALAASAGDLALPGAAGELASGGKRSRLVAVFAGVTRKGPWRVPKRMDAVTIFAGAELDLRYAVLPPGEVRIRAICVLGGMEITVPPEMRVVDDGWAIMGGREIPPDTPESRRPDAPVLHLGGMTILGGVAIRRRPREADSHIKPQN